MAAPFLAPLAALLLAGSAGTANLTVTYWPKGAPGPSTRWTLRCGPAGGTHPHPAAACAALARHPEALKPVPPQAVCSLVYGGPQVARVRGRYRGRAVDAKLNRENGCEVARWSALVPLVPKPPPTGPE